LLHQVAGADGKLPSALVQQAPTAILPVSNLHAFERFHMGIALLAFSGLFQGLANVTRPAPQGVKSSRNPAYLRPLWATQRPACTPQALKTSPLPHRSQAPSVRPALRVVRVTDSDSRVKGAGRMVISGRMADVCAELDRLAALEAAQSRV
jgi:hypothetical protein